MFKGLTYSFTILFILLLVNLSLNARFAADDYYFLYLKANLGSVGGTIFQYMDFSGRWLCHFISLLILNLSGLRFFLPAYFIFTFAVLYLILSSLFYKIYTHYDRRNDLIATYRHYYLAPLFCVHFQLAKIGSGSLV